MRLALPLFFASALSACSWGADLQSDPAFWSPARVGSGDAEGDADGSAIDPACTDEMSFDPNLRTSSASSLSHFSGQGCLEGCHEKGGSARATFAAGGTIYRSQTSHRVAAAGGTVQGVGGSTLTLDRCGNFYAVVGALAGAADLTQPYVQSPTLHRMEKPLFRQKNPGSCNQSGCHDFGGKLRWGVYY